jgi:RNase adaptor protein for sRNA GlmZ degradation
MKRFGEGMNATNPTLTITTFGFKYGTPRCNYYFDVSFLPNPARLEKFSLHSELDSEMLDYIRKQDGAHEIVEIIVELSQFIATKDVAKIGIGCNSGRHRSRAIAAMVCEKLDTLNIAFSQKHED